MILISHRGNRTGPNKDQENKPIFIDDTLNRGFDCEIDIRMVDNQLYLGHDEPQYKIDIGWLYKRRHKLWVHCKDLKSFEFLNNIHAPYLNLFFHESDLGVLTSFNYIWSSNVVKGGILVMPELFNTKPIAETVGICSDYIVNYEKTKK